MQSWVFMQSITPNGLISVHAVHSHGDRAKAERHVQFLNDTQSLQIINGVLCDCSFYVASDEQKSELFYALV